MRPGLKVLIKGAGEMASGVAWRLHQSHFRLLMTETAHPLAIRRAVSYCEAVFEGHMVVEDVSAILINRSEDIPAAWERFQIPLMIDPPVDGAARFQSGRPGGGDVE